MDLTLPGKKVEIVYSICRIRQFTDTTECLKEEIIVFVNKIVKIIHLCTQNWDGKPTKNYGERFMITWKLPSYDLAIDKGSSQRDNIASSDRLNMLSGELGSGGNDGDDIYSKANATNEN